MQAVGVQTTQNVQLDYTLASVGERLLAFIIDAAIILGIILLLQWIGSLLDINGSIAYNVIFSIIAYLYRLISEVSFNGQTVGKIALKIRVIKMDGSEPGVSAYFLRWLLEPIDFFLSGLGLLFIILNKNAQRIGDILAGTVVIKNKKIELTNIQNKEIMQPVDDDYEPQFYAAANITDQEVNIIKEALRVYQKEAISKPIKMLEVKMKDKYEIESDLPTVKFLYAVLRDHTYFVTRK